MKRASMCIRYAVFDLDGTLLDSMPVWDTVGERFLMQQGMAVPAGLRDTLKEMSTEQSAVYFQQLGIALSKEEIIRSLFQIIKDDYLHRIPLKSGAFLFLQGLKQSGARLCIATATDSREIVQSALERLAVLQYFDFIVTCSDVGSGKDEPAIFLECARRFKAESADVTVFEDALYSIQTAKSAGFSVVGVQDASSAAQEQQIKAAADIYIRSFQELL